MTDVLAGNLGYEKLVGASKGIACTTTAAVTAIPNGANHLTLMPRNFATAVVVKYAINPYLFIVKQSGASTFSDISDEAQDGDSTSIIFDSFDVIANNEALYIGSHQRFGGVKVNMVDSKVNATNSVLTVKYRKDNDTWTDISDVDGTINSSSTFGKDGNVTWTTPSDWKMDTMINIADFATVFVDRTFPQNQAPLFWTRWEVSVQLDSETEVEEFLPMHDTTGATYPEMTSAIAARERKVKKGPFGDGSIELLTDAGTANVVVVAAAVGASARFP